MKVLALKADYGGAGYLCGSAGVVLPGMISRSAFSRPANGISSCEFPYYYRHTYL